MSDVWGERIDGWKVQSDDARNPFDVDYGRIVHSGSFRRLQGKTQILNIGDSDFYRTRLTHSLEVAQISAGIVRQLRSQYPQHPALASLAPENLVQTLGFAHDLGHPPFGHGGEVALNYCMRDAGGFEGNGQTLRILSKLENFSEKNGSNLSRRSLLGVLKYPVPYNKVANPSIKPKLNQNTSAILIIDRETSKPPKCFLDSENDVVEWILSPFKNEDREILQTIKLRDGGHSKSLHKSFDCSVMDVADDIAYGIHDLEDAIALRLFDENAFRERVPEEKCASFLATLKNRYPGESRNDVYDQFVISLFGPSGTRKRFIGRLVHHLITSLHIETLDSFEHNLLKYRVCIKDEARRVLDALQSIVVDLVIKSPNVQHLEFKGQQMVVAVFEAFSSEPSAFLPADAYSAWCNSSGDPRVICDHVAGMTDSFLLKTYDRLFSPRMGSVFDKL